MDKLSDKITSGLMIEIWHRAYYVYPPQRPNLTQLLRTLRNGMEMVVHCTTRPKTFSGVLGSQNRARNS